MSIPNPFLRARLSSLLVRRAMLGPALVIAATFGGCAGRPTSSEPAARAASERAALAPQEQAQKPAPQKRGSKADPSLAGATPRPAEEPSVLVAQAEPAPPTDAEAAPPASAAAPADGKALYARHCAACHGQQGDGQGVAAAWLFPKPRDFRQGKFRLVSTTNGVPSSDDLHAVLLRGMPGSAMPPWPHLTAEERSALVDEVLRLYRQGMRDFYAAMLKEQEGLEDEELEDPDIQAEIQEFVARRTAPGEVSAVPEIGPADEEAIARGKELYASQGCASCHGATGKGDGQQQMVDDEGLPTRPRDFTRGVFKGGHDPASLYRRIAYGMPGTPMPSSSKMTPEQMVDLVHFTLSLSDEAARQATILNREQITARLVAKTPEAIDDPAWSQAAPVSLRMTPLWWRDDADPDLQAQAVHDGRTLALRLSWRDGAPNRHEATTQAFEDGAAVELFAGQAEPFLGMGADQEPVDVWLWSASRDVSSSTVDDVYPNAVVDVYPFQESVVSSAEFSREEARLAAQPDVSLPARAVGNPLAVAGDSAATVHAASGPSSLTFRPRQSQLVTAHGQWSDGRWTVILRRMLAADDPADGVSLTSGGRASIAFAVWDGGQGDRDGKKLVTIWQDFELEAE